MLASVRVREDVKGLASKRCDSVLQAAARERVLLPNEFLLDSKLANVNLLDLVGRLAEDHLTMKLAGFAESLASESAAEAVPGLAAMTRRPDAHVADKPPSPSGTGREPVRPYLDVSRGRRECSDWQCGSSPRGSSSDAHRPTCRAPRAA